MDDDKKTQAKNDALKRLRKDIEREGDNDLSPSDEGYNTIQYIFNQTVGHAIDTYGEGEWERKNAQNFIRRHVKLIARIAKSLAVAAGSKQLSAQDIDDAAKLVIKRAHSACDKMIDNREFEALGRPCEGYKG